MPLDLKHKKGSVPTQIFCSSFPPSFQSQSSPRLVAASSTVIMVNFIASVTLLLTAASAAVAVPSGLEKRAVTCRDDLPADTLANVFSFPSPALSTPTKHKQVNEAVQCINYLAGLGGQACVATISGQSYCRRGNTQITGLSRKGNTQTSTW